MERLLGTARINGPPSGPGPEIWTYCGVAMAPFYVLSGILIYFGDKRDGPGLFKLGLIISNPFPIVAFGTIFIPIVHVIALVRLCKYYRERFTAAKNKHQPPTKIAMINQDAAPASYGSRNLSSLGRSLPAK